MVLVATARSQLSVSLDTNVLGFKLLPDEFLRYDYFWFLYQKKQTALLWKDESVRTYTVLSIKGPQGTDRRSEPVGSRWDNQQLLTLSMGYQPTRAGYLQPGEEDTDFTNTWNKNGLLVRTVSCY